MVLNPEYISKSSSRIGRGNLVVSAVVAITVGLLSAHARADDLVLLFLNGHPITVKQATGVGYTKGLAACKAAFRKYPLQHSVKLCQYLRPLPASPSAIVVPPSAPRFYHMLLRSVAIRILRMAVVRRIAASGHVSLDKYCNPRLAPQLAAALSRQNQANREFGLLFEKHHWSLRKYRKELREHFPQYRYSRKYIAWLYRLSNSTRTPLAVDQALQFATPPLLADGSAPLWSTDSVIAGMEQVAVWAVVKKNAAYYRRLASDQMGSWKFVIVKHVVNSARSKRSARALLAALRPKGKNPIFVPVEIANMALSALGSPNRVGFHSLDPITLRGFYGVSPRLVRLNALVASGPLSPKGNCLLLFYARPQNRFAAAHVGPGNFAFDAGTNKLVPAAASWVVHHCTLMKGLRPITAAELAADVVSEAILPYYGPKSKLPQVLPIFPWTVLGSAPSVAAVKKVGK